MAKITVKDTEVTVLQINREDYISLTDIAKVRDRENPSQIISLWLRTYNTIEYLGLWEMLNNPNFKLHIYEGFKNEAGANAFTLSQKNHISDNDAQISYSRFRNFFMGIALFLYENSIFVN